MAKEEPREVIPGVIVDFLETRYANDPVPCVRLYSTQYKSAWTLQIRGTSPLKKETRRGVTDAKNLIASARLGIDEMKSLRDMINKQLGE